jgi:hypothetical protein
VYSLRGTCHTLRNYFGHTRWYSLGTRFKWKLVLVCLEMVLILTQDRCTVCTERIIGLGIILDKIDGLLGDEAQLDAHFGLFGDNTNLDAR